MIGDGSLMVIDSQINVLTSSDVLGEVVDSEHLDRDPEFIKPTPMQALMGTVTSSVGGAGVVIDDRTEAIGKLELGRQRWPSTAAS